MGQDGQNNFNGNISSKTSNVRALLWEHSFPFRIGMYIFVGIFSML